MERIKLQKRIAFIVLILAQLASVAPESRCTFTDTSGYCNQASGRFLRDQNPRIAVLYVIRCDMRNTTREDFAQFPHLATVHIINSNGTGTQSETWLAGLRRLQHLKITNSSRGEDVVKFFKRTFHLKTLSLEMNDIVRINKDDFSHLKKVEVLNLGNNKISEIDVAAFSSLPALRLLILSRNRIGARFNPRILHGPRSVGCFDCESRSSARDEDCGRNAQVHALWVASARHRGLLLSLRDNPLCATVGNASGAVGATAAGDRRLDVQVCELRDERAKFLQSACDEVAWRTKVESVMTRELEEEEEEEEIDEEERVAREERDATGGDASAESEARGEHANPAHGRTSDERGGRNASPLAGVLRSAAGSSPSLLAICAAAGVSSGAAVLVRHVRKTSRGHSQSAASGNSADCPAEGDRARESLLLTV